MPAPSQKFERPPEPARPAPPPPMSDEMAAALHGDTQQLARVPSRAMSSKASPSPLRKLYASPAAFAVVFVVGFGLAFGIGAAVLWRGDSFDAMLERGEADAVLDQLSKRPQLTAQDALWKGHALHAKGNREDMLRAYQGGVRAGVVDDRALKNTLDALGHEKASGLAVKTLEDWPGTAINDTLVALCADGALRKRTAAEETLIARKKDAPTSTQKLDCAVRSAVAGVRSDVCEQKKAGVERLTELAGLPQAPPMLRATDAWKAVYEINNDNAFNANRCLAQERVKDLFRTLSPVENTKP